MPVSTGLDFVVAHSYIVFRGTPDEVKMYLEQQATVVGMRVCPSGVTEMSGYVTAEHYLNQ